MDDAVTTTEGLEKLNGSGEPLANSSEWKDSDGKLVAATNEKEEGGDGEPASEKEKVGDSEPVATTNEKEENEGGDIVGKPDGDKSNPEALPVVETRDDNPDRQAESNVGPTDAITQENKESRPETEDVVKSGQQLQAETNFSPEEGW